MAFTASSSKLLLHLGVGIIDVLDGFHCLVGQAAPTVYHNVGFLVRMKSPSLPLRDHLPGFRGVACKSPKRLEGE